MKFEGDKPLHDWIVENQVSIDGFYVILFTRRFGESWARAGLMAIGKEIVEQYEKLSQMVDAYIAYMAGSLCYNAPSYKNLHLETTS